jgi:UDP-glucose 4-epimerase
LADASTGTKVFVSGGAGFIGSHLVRRLLEQTNIAAVTVYDNLSSGRVNYLAPVRDDPRLTLIEGEISHLGELTHAMLGMDIVLHLAANPDIAKAARQPDIDFWEGTHLSQNILEAMRVCRVPSILYTSGSGVYGEAPGVAFSEDFGPCIPISTYGASKLACEALIASYCHMFGMRGRAFRFANVVGPRQTHGVGHDFIRRLKADPSHLQIQGDGTQCKSYIHVDDAIDAMFFVGSHMKDTRAPSFDIFNVATDDYITVTQIADIACGVAGLTTDTVEYQYTGGDRGWKGDVPQVRFDVSKIKALGWTARHTSQEAVRASIAAMYQEISVEQS